MSICKKCIAPKPPRTHHCSVCNHCVLKMDHHCPWLNNCVGHLNHRHFFLYMVHMILGCLFIMIFGFEIMYSEVFASNETEEYSKMNATKYELGGLSPTIYQELFGVKTLIWFECILTSGCFLVLGGLSYWHGRLIGKGETSIEQHINQSERKRLKKEGKVYKNPYDFGKWHNWCLFLGVVDGRGWWSVILPSTHKPRGDGMEWDSIYSCDVRWNDLDFNR